MVSVLWGGSRTRVLCAFCCPENRASLPLDAACLRKPLTMIDSSKKQQQGFPEILSAEDFEPFKEKECLEGSNQKSLKEGQSVSGHGQDGHAHIPVTLAAGMPSAYHVCLLTIRVSVVCSLWPLHCPSSVWWQLLSKSECWQTATEWFAMIGTNKGIRNLVLILVKFVLICLFIFPSLEVSPPPTKSLWFCERPFPFYY